MYNRDLDKDLEKIDLDDELETEDIEKICYFLQNYDSNYKTKNIWSLYGGASSFYLNKNVHNVQYPVEDGLPNQEKMLNLGNEMKENNVDYFISYNKKFKIPNYKKVKTKGHAALYEKNF